MADNDERVNALVQEGRWFADSDMARKLDIGCRSAYSTICGDMSVAWGHAISPGTKEFVCAVWRRDEQYQDCGQAVGHRMAGEELKLAKSDVWLTVHSNAVWIRKTN